jgi:hypothetical protein
MSINVLPSELFLEIHKYAGLNNMCKVMSCNKHLRNTYIALRKTMVMYEMQSIHCKLTDIYLLLQLAITRYLQETAILVLNDRVKLFSDNHMAEITQNKILTGCLLPNDTFFQVKNEIFTNSFISETIYSSNIMYWVIKDLIQRIVLDIDMEQIESVIHLLEEKCPIDELFMLYLQINSSVQIDNKFLLHKLFEYYMQNMKLNETFIGCYRSITLAYMKINESPFTFVDKLLISKYIKIQGLDNELLFFLFDKIILDFSSTKFTNILPCHCHNHNQTFANKVVKLCLDNPKNVCVRFNYRSLRSFMYISESISNVFNYIYAKESEIIRDKIKILNPFTGKHIKITGKSYNDLINKIINTFEDKYQCTMIKEIEKDIHAKTNAIYLEYF